MAPIVFCENCKTTDGSNLYVFAIRKELLPDVKSVDFPVEYADVSVSCECKNCGDAFHVMSCPPKLVNRYHYLYQDICKIVKIANDNNVLSSLKDNLWRKTSNYSRTGQLNKSVLFRRLYTPYVNKKEFCTKNGKHGILCMTKNTRGKPWLYHNIGFELRDYTPYERAIVNKLVPLFDSSVLDRKYEEAYITMLRSRSEEDVKKIVYEYTKE